jgi:hypothetical protein
MRSPPAGFAGRGAVLALASLSTSLGATAVMGSGAHNICAGHGLCARLLAADGPKLGQGRRPSVGIGAQDERLAAELHRAQSACTYLLIRLLAAEAISVAKFFDGECAGEMRRRHRCSHDVSSFHGHRSGVGGRLIDDGDVLVHDQKYPLFLVVYKSAGQRPLIIRWSVEADRRFGTKPSGKWGATISIASSNGPFSMFFCSPSLPP